MASSGLSTLSSLGAIIDDYLHQYCTRELKPILTEDLYEPMHYSLTAGGKRIRPVLCLAFAGYENQQVSFQTFPEKSAISPALALEFIHTYSLIHDDLPAMDDDDMRRGRPSCHKQFGEWAAILAGDALNTIAFDLAASTDEKLAARTVRILSQKAAQMVSGQALDLAVEKGSQSGKTNLKDAQKNTSILFRIHISKTAALIEAACTIGAVHFKDDPGYAEFAENFGKDLGLLFQYSDDILDATSDSETLGKTAGKDQKSGKLTVVSLHGLEKSKEMATDLSVRLTQLARSNADGPYRDFLIDLPELILHRNS